MGRGARASSPKPVAAAHRRGVRVAVIDYGTLALEAAAVYPHPIKDTISGEKGGRGLTLLRRRAGRRWSASSPRRRAPPARGAATTGSSTAVEDYLKHDIYVQKIVGRFNDLLVRTYGRNYARWRDVFSDRVMPAPATRQRKTARRERKS